MAPASHLVFAENSFVRRRPIFLHNTDVIHHEVQLERLVERDRAWKTTNNLRDDEDGTLTAVHYFGRVLHDYRADVGRERSTRDRKAHTAGLANVEVTSWFEVLEESYCKQIANAGPATNISQKDD